MQYLLESAFCLACFYVFYWLALRRETFFQWNRAYLLLAPLLSFGIPALRVELERQAETPADNFITQDAVAVIAEAQSAPLALQNQLERPAFLPASWSLTVGDALLGVYGLGVAVLALLLAIRMARLFRLIRRCRRERRDDFILASTPTDGSVRLPTASFFSFVFWTKGDTTERGNLILEHELVHVRQRHSLDVLLMELLVIWQWFNPLIWFYRRSLQAVHEFIADDFVARQSRRRHEYALLLAQHYRAPGGTPLLNTFHTQIKKRLLMLAKRPSHRIRRGKFALALPLTAGLALLFSFRLIETLPAAAPLATAIASAEHFAEKIAATPLLASKPNRPEPTPYIFYWGVLQAKIQYVEGTGDYFAEIHTSPAEFREALQREPRLWDGHALRQHCALKVGDQAVRSDYYDETAYAASREKLLEMAPGLTENDYLKIGELALDAGKLAEVFVYFDGQTPRWLPGQTNRPAAGRQPETAYFFQWGDERFDREARQFFTREEFWRIVQSDPALHFEDGRTVLPQNWEVTLVAPEHPRIALDQKMTRSEVLAWLEKMSPNMPDGTTVVFYGSDDRPATEEIIDTIYLLDPLQLAEPATAVPDPHLQLASGEIVSNRSFRQLKLAELTLVPDGDPRLPLRRSERRRFDFVWGVFEQDIMDVFARSFPQPDGSVIRADRRQTTFSNQFTRAQCLDMLKNPARLLASDSRSLTPLRFTLQYKNHTAVAENGICPPEFVSALEWELAPYEKITVSGIQAGAADLGFAELVFEVRNDDPKPPLRPAYAPPNVPVEQQVRLFNIVPNPVQDRLNVTFALPEAGEAVLYATNARGQVVWTKKGAFDQGETRLDLSVDELGEDGWYTLTLEAARVTVQQIFVVAR